MNWLKSILVTVGPRLLASLIPGIATYIGVKTSGAVNIDPVHAGEVVTAIFASYATTHKGLSSIVNPGDAAKGRVASAIKDAAETGTTVKVSPDR